MKVIQWILYLTVVIHLVHCRAIRSMDKRQSTDNGCVINDKSINKSRDERLQEYGIDCCDSSVQSDMGEFSDVSKIIVEQLSNDTELVMQIIYTYICLFALIITEKLSK